MMMVMPIAVRRIYPVHGSTLAVFPHYVKDDFFRSALQFFDILPGGIA
jgi:hypothetical protein